MNRSTSLFRQIERLVSQVPPGRVTSYGRIARQAGCSARTVGFALAALPADTRVPWQRVLNRHGEISPRNRDDGSWRQRLLLEAEGIRFDARGRADWADYGWDFPVPKRVSGAVDDANTRD